MNALLIFKKTAVLYVILVLKMKMQIIFREKREQLDLMTYLNKIINKTLKKWCGYIKNAKQTLQI